MNTPVTDKRRQILDAALALCAEDGLQGAATARIAKAAGVANGTLFHHFPSKEVLIQSLYQDIKLRLGAAITEADAALPLKEQTRHYWSQAMAWMQAHPHELKFVLGFFHSPAGSPAAQPDPERHPAFLPRLLAQGQASGELMQAPPALMLEVCQASSWPAPRCLSTNLNWDGTATGKPAPSPCSGPPSREFTPMHNRHLDSLAALGRRLWISCLLWIIYRTLRRAARIDEAVRQELAPAGRAHHPAGGERHGPRPDHSQAVPLAEAPRPTPAGCIRCGCASSIPPSPFAPSAFGSGSIRRSARTVCWWREPHRRHAPGAGAGTAAGANPAGLHRAATAAPLSEPTPQAEPGLPHLPGSVDRLNERMSTMSRYYDFFCPVKLMAGEQALEQLAGELAGLGARRPLLLTDKGSAALASPPCWPGYWPKSCRWPPSGTRSY